LWDGFFMRQIWTHLKHHLSNDFSWLSYGMTGLVLIVLISLNYGLDIEQRLLVHLSPISYIGFIACLFYFTYFSIVVVHVPRADWNQSSFIWHAALIVGILIMSSSLLYVKDITSSLTPAEARYVQRLLYNSLGSIYTFSGLGLLYLLADRKHIDRFYGLSIKGQRLRPYLILIALMVPLIYYASMQEDFLNTYPQFKSQWYKPVLGLSRTQMSMLFEGFYLLDFVRIELLFRGALVIGLARFVGPKAILPMAALYCVLHFNKPMLEAISSIFGGYLLGVISYYERHVAGGIIVHMGIAGLMELFAYWAM
jgi:hypothetical protein